MAHMGTVELEVAESRGISTRGENFSNKNCCSANFTQKESYHNFFVTTLKMPQICIIRATSFQFQFVYYIINSFIYLSTYLFLAFWLTVYPNQDWVFFYPLTVFVCKCSVSLTKNSYFGVLQFSFYITFEAAGNRIQSGCNHLSNNKKKQTCRVQIQFFVILVDESKF